MEPNTVDTDIVLSLRYVAKSAKPCDAGQMRAAADEIERLRSARRWIPVSERLPEAGVGVLVWSPIDSQCRRACVAAMDRVNGQHLWTSEYGDEMPTHWMPLPEPPTE